MADWYFKDGSRAPASWPVHSINAAGTSAKVRSPRGKNPRVYSAGRLAELKVREQQRRQQRAAAKERERIASRDAVFEAVPEAQLAMVQARLMVAGGTSSLPVRSPAVERRLATLKDLMCTPRWSENKARFLVDLVRQISEAMGGVRDRVQQEEQLRADPSKWLHDGRREVEGEIVSAKLVYNGYGYAVKVLVRDDDGRKYWGTLPRSLDCRVDDDERVRLPHRRVRMTATVKRSGDDPIFGFMSRPAKAQYVTGETVENA